MTVEAELDPREAAVQLLTEHDAVWVAKLTDELDRQLSGHGLERVMRLWQLSRAELGELFGVSRQAVSKWIADGVPADRVQQVADVAAITDLLDRYLKRDRIAAVVRRRAPGLEGASLFELVASGRSRDALRLTRQMFTFTDAHA
ncbi:MAG: hypothetical protein ACLFRD_09975 [Nitriliruptoraceae bacterium]